MQKTKPKLIVILGPTASGKTKLAVKLAKDFNGEIVSADSRQIYKELDIGTAKPSLEIVKIIPHHLVDMIGPRQKFNVALYKRLALKTIRDIRKRGKIPFLVGGTGLYIQAIVDNFDYLQIKPDWKLRKSLEAKTVKQLFVIYKAADPLGAKKIDKNNKRRLVRAIEVCKITKAPFWGQRQRKEPLFDALQLGITLSKKRLSERVSLRTRQMLKAGLERETKRLFKRYGEKLPSLQTIGYQEWLSYLGRKIGPEEEREIIAQIKKHTLQYAKRQMTWFKRDPRIVWINDYRKAKKIIKRYLAT